MCVWCDVSVVCVSDAVTCGCRSTHRHTHSHTPLLHRYAQAKPRSEAADVQMRCLVHYVSGAVKQSVIPPGDWRMSEAMRVHGVASTILPPEPRCVCLLVHAHICSHTHAHSSTRVQAQLYSHRHVSCCSCHHNTTPLLAYDVRAGISSGARRSPRGHTSSGWHRT